MTESFDNWTDYDNWLIKHYEEFAMISLNEKDGKVVVEYIDKAEWDKQQREKDSV